LSERFHYVVHVMKPIHIDHTLVSSTSVRKLVQEGNLSEAKKLLGRNHEISGVVVTGKNRGGRLLGFPTANLHLVDELIPKQGVYAVKVHVDNRTYNGVTNIGYNPTFGNGQMSVETHILDFSEDLVGKTIQVDFIERLREEKTFQSIKELADQIAKDIIQAREILEPQEKPGQRLYGASGREAGLEAEGDRETR